MALLSKGKAITWTKQHAGHCRDGVVNPSFVKMEESGQLIALSSVCASLGREEK